MPAALLTDFSLLRFSGADAAAFLHGQLTCDVLALQVGRSSYGGYCTPKGRLLATFLLWHDDNGYLMFLPKSLAEGIRKRLSMYILRAKVKAESLDGQAQCIGITGADEQQQIAALGGALPNLVHDVTTREGCSVIRLPGDRFLAVTAGAMTDIPADTVAWRAIDIANGIPFIQPVTQEEFVPQMVNLDLIGALTYTKGCYPGQEIVARMHYLGRLKQRMFRVGIAAPAVSGDKLYCAELGEQSAGLIVDAVPMATGGVDALAVLQTAHAMTSPFHCGSPQGPVLTLASLPYPVN